MSEGAESGAVADGIRENRTFKQHAVNNLTSDSIQTGGKYAFGGPEVPGIFFENRECTAGSHPGQTPDQKRNTISPPICPPSQQPFFGLGLLGPLRIPPPSSYASPISLRLLNLSPQAVGTGLPQNGPRSAPITQKSVGVPGIDSMPGVSSPCVPTSQGVPYQSYNMQQFG